LLGKAIARAFALDKAGISVRHYWHDQIHL
jgi:hypothetical protein